MTPIARALVAFVAFVLSAALPSAASAQGRCSCNNGCHAYPGQCIQRGSRGCDEGYAPFCGTRASSCPNAGWVSCAGDCTCVRVTPTDAGVPADVPASTDAAAPTDRPVSPDGSSPADVPASFDGSTPADAPAPADARLPVDAPASADAPPATDVPASVDAPASADAPATSDAPGQPSDRPPVGDDATATGPDGGGCLCAGGACVGGTCYRERCVFNQELGFTCNTPGKACRLIGSDPICVPVCAGVSCASGEFCDERSNGACVVDLCPGIACRAGTTCVRNQCGRWGGPDGGVFIPEAGDAGVDGGAGQPVTATDVGCGCRVGAHEQGGTRAWWLSAALAGLMVRRSRRRR